MNVSVMKPSLEHRCREGERERDREGEAGWREKQRKKGEMFFLLVVFQMEGLKSIGVYLGFLTDV